MAESKLRNNIVGNPSQFGGGGNMNDKYVTHQELDNAVDRLSHKMDLMEAHIDTKFANVDTKFAEQESKFFKNMMVVASISIAIIGLLIKFL